MPLSRIKSNMEVSQLRLNSSAASTDVNERVLLDASAAATDAGYAIILEDSTANAPSAAELARPLRTINSGDKGHAQPYGIVVERVAIQAYSASTWAELVPDHIAMPYGGAADFDMSTGRFSPSIAGVYDMKFHTYQSSSDSTNWARLTINGDQGWGVGGGNQTIYSDYLSGNSNPEADAYMLNGAGIMYLGTNDYVSLWMYGTDSSSPGTVAASGSLATFWSCMLMHRMD